MSIRSDEALLRKLIGDRKEHHACCRSQQGLPCDCYAWSREKYHAALDRILAKRRIKK